MPHTVVIAPDSFKGSIGARDAAEAIAAGWRRVRPGDTILVRPQADGGEGTLDAIAASVPGSMRHTAVGVAGPDARETDADWLALPDGTAVIELAQSSGLPLMATPDPLGASTRGLGEVVLAVLGTHPRRLLIGLGGSASTDGGAGALAIVPHVGIEVVMLADVTNPLLGPAGAAATFAPQKGATPAQVAALEQRMIALVAKHGGDPEAAGAGAAGGTAWGLATAWGATIRSGSEYIATLTCLDSAIDAADAVLTGEGRFDAQSLAGKSVGRVLSGAAVRDVPSGIIAGSLGMTSSVWALSLEALAGSAAAAVADPERWLREAGARAAREVPC